MPPLNFYPVDILHGTNEWFQIFLLKSKECRMILHHPKNKSSTNINYIVRCNAQLKHSKVNVQQRNLETNCVNKIQPNVIVSNPGMCTLWHISTRSDLLDFELILNYHFPMDQQWLIEQINWVSSILLLRATLSPLHLQHSIRS